MVKISIAGSKTMTKKQRKQLDTAIFEAVMNYVGQFPTEAVQINWRKERSCA